MNGCRYPTKERTLSKNTNQNNKQPLDKYCVSVVI